MHWATSGIMSSRHGKQTGKKRAQSAKGFGHGVKKAKLHYNHDKGRHSQT